MAVGDSFIANLSKGPAVRSLRIQTDKKNIRYIFDAIKKHKNIHTKKGRGCFFQN